MSAPHSHPRAPEGHRHGLSSARLLTSIPLSTAPRTDANRAPPAASRSA